MNECYCIIEFILWMNVTIILSWYDEWILLYYWVYIMNECYYIIKFILWINVIILLSLYYEWMLLYY